MERCILVILHVPVDAHTCRSAEAALVKTIIAKREAKQAFVHAQLFLIFTAILKRRARLSALVFGSALIGNQISMAVRRPDLLFTKKSRRENLRTSAKWRDD